MRKNLDLIVASIVVLILGTFVLTVAHLFPMEGGRATPPELILPIIASVAFIPCLLIFISIKSIALLRRLLK